MSTVHGRPCDRNHPRPDATCGPAHLDAAKRPELDAHEAPPKNPDDSRVATPAVAAIDRRFACGRRRRLIARWAGHGCGSAGALGLPAGDGRHPRPKAMPVELLFEPRSGTAAPSSARPFSELGDEPSMHGRRGRQQHNTGQSRSARARRPHQALDLDAFALEVTATDAHGRWREPWVLSVEDRYSRCSVAHVVCDGPPTAADYQRLLFWAINHNPQRPDGRPYGVPESIHTDLWPAAGSVAVDAVCQTLRIDHRYRDPKPYLPAGRQQRVREALRCSIKRAAATGEPGTTVSRPAAFDAVCQHLAEWYRCRDTRLRSGKGRLGGSALATWNAYCDHVRRVDPMQLARACMHSEPATVRHGCVPHRGALYAHPTLIALHGCQVTVHRLDGDDAVLGVSRDGVFYGFALPRQSASAATSLRHSTMPGGPNGASAQHLAPVQGHPPSDDPARSAEPVASAPRPAPKGSAAPRAAISKRPQRKTPDVKGPAVNRPAGTNRENPGGKQEATPVAPTRASRRAARATPPGPTVHRKRAPQRRPKKFTRELRAQAQAATRAPVRLDRRRLLGGGDPSKSAALREAALDWDELLDGPSPFASSTPSTPAR